MHCGRPLQRQSTVMMRVQSLPAEAQPRAGWTMQRTHSSTGRSMVSSKGSSLLHRAPGAGWSMRMRKRWVLHARASAWALAELHVAACSLTSLLLSSWQPSCSAG